MQVLKFGGSSVGSAEAISKVVAIVSESVKKEPTIVVVSAMSGVTDQLLMLAQSASQGNEAYKTIIQNIEQKHLDAVRALLPIQAQSATLSLVKQTINELESPESCNKESNCKAVVFIIILVPHHGFLRQNRCC